jgi:hypothetical protein
MIRGTTPDYILEGQGVDLSGRRVYVTFAQGNYKFTRTNENLTMEVDTSGQTVVTRISITLTQEETLRLHEGTVRIQIKAIDSDGNVDASECMSAGVGQALLEKVITYAADPTI